MGGRRWYLLLALLVAACDSGAATTTTTTSTATTTTTLVTTTTVAATTTTAPLAVEVLALPVAADVMGPEWVEAFFIPYGATEDTLGSSPGGEGGTLDLGPEFGAQAPDGTWWFLDAAKTRLARFTADGAFIDALAIPAEVLTSGVYFQFQLPRVLADGTLVAFGLRDTTTAVLRATGAGIDQVEVTGLMVLRADDGTLAYGFDDAGNTVAVDIATGTATPADYFRTQTGARYRFGMTDGGLRIELPDAPVPVDRVVPLVSAADPTVRAFGSIEAATTADGRIHLFIAGASEADESVQLAGYSTILPDGTVTAVVPTRNPFTLSDSGSPSHLGAAFGANAPWLMIIDTDGVRVYRPAGG